MRCVYMLNLSSPVKTITITDISGIEKGTDMVEIKVYVGLNDSITKKQIFETEKYISILRNVCIAYKTPFSFDVVEGGYIHENGEYTTETSLVLTLIDAERSTVHEIAKDLCAFFHQESVMITEGQISTYYVSEGIEK